MCGVIVVSGDCVVCGWFLTLYTSCRGRRRGRSVGRLGGTMASKASSRIGPLRTITTSTPPVSTHASSLSALCHPVSWLLLTDLYHFMLSDRSMRLSPFHPEMGMNGMVSPL